MRCEHLLQVLVSLLSVLLVLGERLTVVFEAFQDHLIPLALPLSKEPEHQHLLLLMTSLPNVYSS